MAAGLKYGYIDPENVELKQKHYELIQVLAKQFKKRNGSIICRDILGLDISHDSPVPEARTEEYYNKRPCVDVIRAAAEIIDELFNIKGGAACD